MRICIYLLEPKFAILYKLKHGSQWNSTVDLLVIAFFSKRGTYFTKITSCGPSTSWEGKNGSQLLVVYFIQGEIFRMRVDIGDA